MGKVQPPLPGDDHEYSLSVEHLPDVRLTMHIFAAHRRTVHPDWVYPEHTHPMFELNMVLGGGQRYRVGAEDYLMERGDILLLRPEEKHECRIEGATPMTYGCIHFDVDEPVLRQALCSIRSPYHKSGSPLAQAVRPVLERIGGRTGDWAQGKAASSKLETLDLTFGLFGALTRLLADPPAGLTGDAHSHGGLAAQLAEQMAERLAGLVKDKRSITDEESFVSVNIERISQELGYSPAYCNRVFKNVFGMSPRRYLSTLKLTEAKLLLVNRRLTVEEIADRLGYKDVSQFSKQFKRWMNISPSQYRQML